MNQRNIALSTGGYSGESVISYKTADTIQANADPERWLLYKIDIHPEGWFYMHPNGKRLPVDKNDFTVMHDGKQIKFDAALIALHGTPGEDGKLQGYFDCIGIPYTSCDAATSALTFNKRYTVAVAAFGGIKVAKSVHLFRENPVSAEEVLSSLQLPVFVKPNNGGSSIGMSKVTETAALPGALEKAFREDSQVLVEECVQGREFTIGVFRTKGNVVPLPITEIISKKDFFDYEAKYHGASEEVTPAHISEVVAEKIKATAVKVYRIFNCRGVVRIDFILQESTGEPYMLEINTVPGQSEASIVPQQVQAMGWTLRDFYTALLEECLNN